MAGANRDIDCFDFGALLTRLANLRRADDLIIVSLNNDLPTRSFPDCQKSKQICEKFRLQLTAVYEERRTLIQRCITEVADRAALEAPDTRPLRILLRQIKGEQDVEQIIQNRSEKAIHERCNRV